MIDIKKISETTVLIILLCSPLQIEYQIFLFEYQNYLPKTNSLQLQATYIYIYIYIIPTLTQ